MQKITVAWSRLSSTARVTFRLDCPVAGCAGHGVCRFLHMVLLLRGHRDCSQLFRMRSFIAWLFFSIYRDVITNEACPARRRTSSREPPYRLMFRAAFVMKVRLPECEVHPTNPSDLYQPSTFDFPLKSTEMLELRDARFRFPLASVTT